MTSFSTIFHSYVDGQLSTVSAIISLCVCTKGLVLRGFVNKKKSRTSFIKDLRVEPQYSRVGFFPSFTLLLTNTFGVRMFLSAILWTRMDGLDRTRDSTTEIARSQLARLSFEWRILYSFWSSSQYKGACQTSPKSVNTVGNHFPTVNSQSECVWQNWAYV